MSLDREQVRTLLLRNLCTITGLHDPDATGRCLDCGQPDAEPVRRTEPERGRVQPDQEPTL